MSMDSKRIRRIAEYLQDSDKAYDSDMEEDLYELWDECDGAPAPSPRMLERLDRAVKRMRMQTHVKRVALWLTGAAMVAGVYSAGYVTAPDTVVEVRSLPQQYVIVTAEGSVGNYKLPDGTDVWLNGSSRLEYMSDFVTDRKAKLVGEGYFDVQRDTLHPFILNMEHLQVEVLGTAFDARSYGNGAIEDVVLRRGSVKVEAADGTTSATLVPNERLVYNPAVGRAVTQDVDAINYCRWMEDRITFSNMPLSDILTNLERKYNVEISIAGDLNGNRRLSLTVGHDPLDEVLAVVNALTGTSTRYGADGSILLTRRGRSM